MCLTNIKKKKPTVLKEDMIVYKHIDPRWELGKYHTPYQHAPVIFNEILNSDLILIQDHNAIGIGFHSFINKEDAEWWATHWDEKLVQCTIPKGARIYIGTYKGYYHSSPCKCIASDKIRYDKILNE